MGGCAAVKLMMFLLRGVTFIHPWIGADRPGDSAWSLKG
jgi:hypothetical protein